MDKEISATALQKLIGVRKSVLAELVDRHLLVRATGPAGNRYQFPEVVHRYVVTMPTDHSWREAFERLATTALATIEHAVALLMPGALRPSIDGISLPPAAPVTVVGEWFDEWQEDLVAITEQAYEVGSFAQCWRLVAGLTPLLDTRIAVTDWQRLVRLGLAAAERTNDDVGKALMLLAQGELLRYAARYDVALEKFAEAVVLFRRLHNNAGVALALHSCGDMRLGLRDDAGEQREIARAELLQSQALFEEMHNDRGVADVLSSLGEISGLNGRLDDALDHLRAALDRYVELNDIRRQATTLRLISAVQRRRDQPDLAVQVAKESVALHNRFDDQPEKGRAFLTLGLAHEEAGERGVAIELYRRAVHIFRTVVDLRWEAQSCFHLARAMKEAQYPRDEWLPFLDRASFLCEKIGDAAGAAAAEQVRADSPADVP